MSPASLETDYLERLLTPNSPTITDVVDEAINNTKEFVGNVQSQKSQNISKTAQEFLKDTLNDINVDGHHNETTPQFGLQCKKRIDSDIVKNPTTYWRDEEKKIRHVNGATGGRLYVINNTAIIPGNFYIK
ncbi:hypothetical protein ACFQET_06520 [Levilactobacillus tangyuanensis]|uniref:Uncharacterized protein n=1 Tax=Levilactobacillus tangyuanensis TaxID=2486021 RepID=A0ABW1TPJ3_9LACO|nr:hypothetical protein [Levilactobacillus tangyuanensis]